MNKKQYVLNCLANEGTNERRNEGEIKGLTVIGESRF